MKSRTLVSSLWFVACVVDCYTAPNENFVPIVKSRIAVLGLSPSRSRSEGYQGRSPWLVVSMPMRAYQAGPPPGMTGGFGEGTCIECHATYELNEGRKSGLGELMVSGLPEKYEPGKTYRVTVKVDHTEGRMAWGFQFAVREKGGAQAGELKPVNGNTQILARDAVQYIEHTPDGVFANVFEFDWVAPGGPVADVVVNMAGNAANGDTDIYGDYIYSTSVTIPVASH